MKEGDITKAFLKQNNNSIKVRPVLLLKEI